MYWVSQFLDFHMMIPLERRHPPSSDELVQFELLFVKLALKLALKVLIGLAGPWDGP